MGERENAQTVRFGRFLLDSHGRELLLDGVPVPIGGRAFDVLSALTEARGQLVTKDELLNRVWPGRYVEENCLQFHISALRKALGSDRNFIKTIAGRGYRFVADISTCGQSPPVTATASGHAGHQLNHLGHSNLFAVEQAAMEIAMKGIGRAHPGTEFETFSLAELAKALSAAPGQPLQLEVLLPSVPVAKPLAEHDPVMIEGVRMALTPEHLLLLLSIGALTLGLQNSSSPSQDRLAA